MSSISASAMQQRIEFKHAILQRKVDPLGLKPQAGIVADVTGSAPSGFGTVQPIPITYETLQNLLGLDVVYSASVPNRIGGDNEKLAVSVKLDTPPDEWLGQICEGIPETGRLLQALRGLYALKAKLDTLVGKPVEAELRELINDPSRVQAALAELNAAEK